MNDQSGAAFATPGQDPESFRNRGINLISSVRTLCRGEIYTPQNCTTQTLQILQDERLGCAKHADRTDKTVPLILVNTCLIIYELVLG